MTGDEAFGDLDRAIAAFVAAELGCEPTRVERVAAFATNAVFEVDADGHRLVVKASPMHGALRGEAWACARGRQAGCPAPAILGSGRLAVVDGPRAFVMGRVGGRPIPAMDPAFTELGARLRRLHEVTLPSFGWLAEASWDERGAPSPTHDSWPGFLNGLLGEARGMADAYALAAPVCAAAAAAIDAHVDALAAVEVGSLCHGDLKAAHVLVDEGGIAGVIDWGDAVVADPLWDVARLAHRADPRSLSLLLDGYDPERAVTEELAWRLPLYGALWMLVDAIVDHRLGRSAEAPLEAAMAYLRR